MKCNICGSNYADNYFKDEYTDEIICEECLLEIDGIATNTETHYFLDGEYMGSNFNYTELLEIDGIATNTETHYFLDGEYMGSNFNYTELLENICDNTTYKKLKEGD